MKIITGKVRACYVSVFEQRHNDLSEKDEYSMCLLIPKTDRKTVQTIQAATQAAIEAQWGDRSPAKLRLPLRDGDTEKPENKTFEGHYFMNVKSAQKPGIVDVNTDPVLDRSEFMSGDYCRVSLNSFAYDKAGSKGVSFGLNNIQVLCKGESLAGRARAEDDFSPITPETDTSEWG